MAKRPMPDTPQQAELSQQQIERGIRRIEKQLEVVRRFDPQTLDASDPYSTVRPLGEAVKSALAETFGVGTIEYNRFYHAASFDWPIVMGRGGIPHHEKVKHVTKDRNRSIQLLGAALDLLRDRLEHQEQAITTTGGTRAPTHASSRIFVVHGHDEGPKEATARFLGQLGFEPVVLHEQPNRGRTIIQKFQDEAADVGFAVVLLTPDDAMPNGQMRARQNVIIELGFFLGRLGHDRVAATVKDQVETPSDFDGVVYIPYGGDWKRQIATELQAAGYTIDWNMVMR